MLSGAGAAGLRASHEPTVALESPIGMVKVKNPMGSGNYSSSRNVGVRSRETPAELERENFLVEVWCSFCSLGRGGELFVAATVIKCRNFLPSSTKSQTNLSSVIPRCISCL
jgi:hypothetical protein